MSTRSDAVSEPAVEDGAVARPAPAPKRLLLWSVRRELWENRSLYVAPLVVAAMVLGSFSISAMVTLPRRLRAVASLDAAQQGVTLLRPYSMAASMIIAVSIVVAVFYCLDALYGERRDRSILFWKSLPVSDLTVVLAKVCVPLVVLPVLAYGIALATQLLMFAFANLVALASGAGVRTLWTRLPLASTAVVMLYGVVVHALWHAPIYGWLLLVSGWARRAVFLWAALPLLAICMVEKMASDTSIFAMWLGYRVVGAMSVAFTRVGPHGQVHRLGQLDPIGFLGSAGLWTGLALAAGFITLAVRLRRYRDPI
jgi:ABC-2 type transport system permease protein